MTIYVFTDKNGIILEFTDDIVSVGHKFITENGLFNGEYIPFDIRTITVTTTDGIVGKHWQDCDETMLMLRECDVELYNHEKNVGRSAQFDEGVWKVREDECFENQSTDTIDMCHTMLVKTPDLHTALTHLTSKEA